MNTEVIFKDIEKKIIENLKVAESSVDIAVAWLTSPKIIREIGACLKRKVIVRIISVDDKINGDVNFSNLYRGGAKIRLLSSKLMHNVTAP